VSGDDYFDSLEAAIRDAKNTVEMESYIFNNDYTGNRIIEILAAASERGVKVRLIVDGIGSMGWEKFFGERAMNAGIQYRIYHQLPWEHVLLPRRAAPKWQRVWRLIVRLNNRNHRKVCIIDRHIAYVGSINVADDHVASIRGAKAWRDTAVRLRGEDVRVLVESFERIWLGSTRLFRRRLRLLRRRPRSSVLVRLNLSRRQRAQSYAELLERIDSAERRIWITNAYFVPDGSLLRALSLAARRGVDVRIIVPKVSDVFFVPVVHAAFHYSLLKAGVRVFQYVPSVLHAKTIMIDDWAIVGSSNLNHRSMLHDLEADVVISSLTARRTLEQHFLEDIGNSEEAGFRAWDDLTWLQKLGARFLLAFRFFL